MKLTLDKSWELCLKQWRWIAKQIRAGDRRAVKTLKRTWCKEKGFDIQHDCFFCEYDQSLCYDCPANKVDKAFRHCIKEEYCWNEKPLKFYAKLLELNRKRKKK